MHHQQTPPNEPLERDRIPMHKLPESWMCPVCHRGRAGCVKSGVKTAGEYWPAEPARFSMVLLCEQCLAVAREASKQHKGFQFTPVEIGSFVAVRRNSVDADYHLASSIRAGVLNQQAKTTNRINETRVPASPCESCGGAIVWQDALKNLWCMECEPPAIPSMVRGKFHVLWSEAGGYLCAEDKLPDSNGSARGDVPEGDLDEWFDGLNTIEG